MGLAVVDLGLAGGELRLPAVEIAHSGHGVLRRLVLAGQLSLEPVGVRAQAIVLGAKVVLALGEGLVARLDARDLLREVALARGERLLAGRHGLLVAAERSLALGERALAGFLAGLHLGLAARHVLLAPGELRLLRGDGLRLLREVAGELLPLA